MSNDGLMMDRLVEQSLDPPKGCQVGASCRLTHALRWVSDHNRSQVPPRMRFRVLKRDGFRCQYCGATPKDGVRLEVDHVHPRALGGKHYASNLVTACHVCNIGKGAERLDA